jgi:hypothetical protein
MFHFLIHVPKSAAPASRRSVKFLSQAGLGFDSLKSFRASIFGCPSAYENASGIHAKNNRQQKLPIVVSQK